MLPGAHQSQLEESEKAVGDEGLWILITPLHGLHEDDMLTQRHVPGQCKLLRYHQHQQRQNSLMSNLDD